MGIFLEHLEPYLSAICTRRTIIKGAVAGAGLVLTYAPNFKTGLRFTQQTAEAGENTFPVDFDLPKAPGIPEGHFYTQTREKGDPNNFGFLITNDQDGNFWDKFKSLGGPEVVGYPISRRFFLEGVLCQLTQKALLSRNPETNQIVMSNLLDIMHGYNLDNWLLAQGIPLHFTGKDETNRQTWLTDEDFRNVYSKNANPEEIYGSPTSRPEKIGPFTSQRFQRVAFLKWDKQVEGGPPVGTIQIASVGELLKKTGLIAPGTLKTLAYPYTEIGPQEIKPIKFDPGLAFKKGDPNQPFVYLTFDDFWDWGKGEIILNILKEKGVKATLCPVGAALSQKPDLVRRAHAEGHGIENHTYDHPRIKGMDSKQLTWQITAQQNILRSIIDDPNFQQHFFRPPYGEYDAGTVAVCQSLGLKVVHWSVDSRDWERGDRTDTETLSYIKRNMGRLSPGDIVLGHALRSKAAVLPGLIDQTQKDDLHIIPLHQGIKTL